MHWHAPTDIIFYTATPDGINPARQVKNSCNGDTKAINKCKFKINKDRHRGEARDR